MSNNPPLQSQRKLAGDINQALDLACARAYRSPQSVKNYVRRPSPFATLYPAEVVTAALDNGGSASVFVKHLGSEEADHPNKRRRDREVRVYEELLHQSDLPVVEYYGSCRNEQAVRTDLFLEYIDGWDLRYHGMEAWLVAAQRLAELHAFFAQHTARLSTCEFLLQLNSTYFCEWADRAVSAAARTSVALARELRSIVGNHDDVANRLTMSMTTLVHNDLSAKNIIADQSVSSPRVCIVDWEMAGVGCGLLDLVHLEYGLPPVAVERLRVAYSEGLRNTGPSMLIPQDLDRLIAACELHKTLYRIARSAVWNITAERIAEWVDEARDSAVRCRGFHRHATARREGFI